ncbi:MAG: transglycosylase family protein [Dermatophilus congolensis]|nr:transglycosylase family protein [Dermatophilus congolensis]
MSYVPKHAAARKPSIGVRIAGVCAVAGAAVAGSIATSSSASAASNVWDRVAACESGGNWKISTGNGYYGGLQFSASSWRAAGGAKYAKLPHHATKAQQIATAQNLLRIQGPGAWPTCGRKAGLTRANGLASGGGVAAAAKKSAPKAVNYAPRAFLNREQNRDLNQWLGLERSPFMTKTSVAALQKKVGVKADGVVGRATVRAVERHVGAKLTGAPHFTKATMNKLAAHVAAN